MPGAGFSINKQYDTMLVCVGVCVFVRVGWQEARSRRGKLQNTNSCAVLWQHLKVVVNIVRMQPH